MNVRTVTLQLPENLYLRLQQAAQSTKQSLNEVFLHAVQVGSPPGWEDIPAEFQADVAALDRLDDAALWRIVRQKQPDADMTTYQALLDQHANGTISEAEIHTLHKLRTEADRFMIRKAHAAALLRWRGHHTPPSDAL
jgi:hypothetical protein